jgi:hypothetical protein
MLSLLNKTEVCLNYGWLVVISMMLISEYGCVLTSSGIDHEFDLQAG